MNNPIPFINKLHLLYKYRGLFKVLYDNFKLKLKKSYPSFSKITELIENKVNLKRLEVSLRKKKAEMRSLGQPKSNLNALLTTSALEAFIKKKRKFPDSKELKFIFEILGKKVLPKLAKVIGLTP